MALGKIFKLGGIDNRPPKTDQSLGGMRVARNVMPTPDNLLVPRFDNAEVSPTLSGVVSVEAIVGYEDSVLSLTSVDSSGDGVLRVFRDGVQVPQTIAQAGFSSIVTSSSDRSTFDSYQTYRINNTQYFLAPTGYGFLKYDGQEFGYAGCPQPIFAVETADLTGTRFVRAVQHTIDFDYNEPVSEYVQFTTGAAGATGISTTQVPGGASTLVPTTGVAGVIPAETPLFSLPSSASYFIGTAAYAAGEFTITASDTNISDSAQLGGYLFVSGNAADAVSAQFTTSAGITAFGIAFKISSISPLKLDATTGKYLDSNRIWRDYDFSAIGAAIAATITYGTRFFLSFWESTSSTGIYYYRAQRPAFPASVASFVFSLVTTGTAVATAGSEKSLFTYGPALNDWYDVNSRKVDFNSGFNFGTDGQGGGFKGIAKYQNLFALYNEDYIWISDTTSGGWIEQGNMGLSALIGDKEYGDITSVCGTNDFLFVSRERKNYYVTGNISTGNYRVQEIPETSAGAWNNSSSLNIKDSVVFLSTSGVYQLIEGGRTVNLSDKCPKNFENYLPTSVNEDVVFRMDGDLDVSDMYGMASAYDNARELLVFMKRQPGNPCLVLHAKTGEFYEWEGVSPTTGEDHANCLTFIKSNYCIGTMTPENTNASIFAEDKSASREYLAAYPAKIYSTWLTGGEPSLEKEVLQLKMFGRISASPTYPIIVRHFKDWNYNTTITDARYHPVSADSMNNQVQYSHKQRLNSDKCLSASIGIELSFSASDFELESFEVEFNPIQSGMKR